MLLTSIFSILCVSLLALFFIPSTNIQLTRYLSLVSSAIVLVLSCGLLVQFDCNTYYFKNVVTYTIGSDFINLYF
jgi:NADH:ubiquinone oxidoreductase subunit 4 (subunit M)